MYILGGIFMEPRERLIALSIKYGGDFNKILKAAHDVEFIEDCYKEAALNLKCGTITLADLNYPSHLKNIYKPPLVLFYYGDISLIENPLQNISMVGSRDYSPYGERMATEIATGLAKKGYNIVSGLARGIDSIAHKSAIEAGGKTIAVLGCGIDMCYPSENQELWEEIKKNHLLISEYPGLTPPTTASFPIRNRIIAGLSKTLVVAEAGEHSGSCITATLAMNGNTDVMCVPYPAGSKSQCNKLISMGAALVESADDVIDQMPKF